jgi:hypothetical protein
MRRHLHRESDGRFRQGDLERDFGIRTAICPGCGAINPYTRREVNGFIDPAGWQRPSHCGQCGAELPKEN